MGFGSGGATADRFDPRPREGATTGFAFDFPNPSFRSAPP